MYSTPDVRIVGSSSDGDMMSTEVAMQLDQWNVKNGLFWYHFYGKLIHIGKSTNRHSDYSHIIRNIRNQFIPKDLLLPDDKRLINAKVITFHIQNPL